jgi:hypothetical protein
MIGTDVSDILSANAASAIEGELGVLKDEVNILVHTKADPPDVLVAATRVGVDRRGRGGDAKGINLAGILLHRLGSHGTAFPSPQFPATGTGSTINRSR